MDAVVETRAVKRLQSTTMSRCEAPSDPGDTLMGTWFGPCPSRWNPHGIRPCTPHMDVNETKEIVIMPVVRKVRLRHVCGDLGPFDVESTARVETLAEQAYKEWPKGGF